MAESTIADFVARFVPGSGEPRAGRVVLSERRLVLADGRRRVTIPLADVYDVVVGQVPADLAEFFDETVAIAYVGDGDRETAVVEADGGTVTRFRTVLFEALLGGESVETRHPLRVGGHRRDPGSVPATLHVRPEAVRLAGENRSIGIELGSVTAVRAVDRADPAIEVVHTNDGAAIATEIAVDSARRLNLLERYLRLEQAGLAATIEELEIDRGELEFLTARYAGLSGERLAGVLETEPDGVEALVDSTVEQALLEERGDGRTRLTPLGRVAVADRLDGVDG